MSDRGFAYEAVSFALDLQASIGISAIDRRIEQHRAAALREAARHLEATAEHGTRDACLLLRSMADEIEGDQHEHQGAEATGPAPDQTLAPQARTTTRRRA